MTTEAIILAGGAGTRLQKIVADLPKPMALVNGKPFLEYLLTYLSGFNISHVVLSVGYKAEIIQQYFGNNFGEIKLSYATEKQPIGTGGGIRLALKQTLSKHVFILNGDTFFNADLNALKKKHLQNKANLTMALKKIEDSSRYGTVKINESKKILGFAEKIENKKNALINGGVYLINKESFLDLRFPEKFSFEKEYMEKYVGEKKFYGLVFDTYFIDIGIPETYKKAQSDFLNEFGKKEK